MLAVEATFQMWFVLAVIAVAITLFASEKIELEVSAAGVVAILLLFFHLFPVEGPDGADILSSRDILAGLADPALIAVLALLVIGQGIVRTAALEQPVRRLVSLRRHHPMLAIAVTLGLVLVISGVLNNTPVVVIFIPVMTALAERMHRPTSSLMIPLSYAAILGGMTTLIGSSTNLLVSSAATHSGMPALKFFDFTLIGGLVAAIGFVFAIFVVPRLLPDRSGMATELVGGQGRQFIVQLEIAPDSPLVGESAVAGRFKSLPDITVRIIQRGESVLLPPFDDIVLQAGDVLVLATTRSALTDAFSRNPAVLAGLIAPEDIPEPMEGEIKLVGDQVLAEAVVAPASRIIGRALHQVSFHYRTHCVVLGVQRRSRMIRTGMLNAIRLEAGDVLLVFGHRRNVMKLRNNPDVLLLEWSARDVPAVGLAQRALGIFAVVVGLAATGLVPIVVAAVAGAVAMIASNCLNIFQAARAVDRRIMLLVWASLALGSCLEATGGAMYLASTLLQLLNGLPPAVILSAFFLLVSLFTNILSNNATAVLFTPIAIGMSGGLGVDPFPFVIAVLLAANCSFATPIGYQTNLLVMAPGHYQFRDFLKAGIPLVLVVWISFSLLAPWLYDL